MELRPAYDVSQLVKGTNSIRRSEGTSVGFPYLDANKVSVLLHANVINAVGST